MPENSTVVLSTEKKSILTGLQVMILGDVEVDEPWMDQPIEVAENSWNKKKRTSFISETIPPIVSNEDALYSEKLTNLLMAICLKYPFWNDFRVLDYFNKRGISMTMEELKNLRSECDMETKEDVCLELMRLYSNNEIELGKRQVQFIERVNPAFRDRDFLGSRPGEVLAYECIFFRRLNKMFYLHLVFDLFNGYVFGRVNRHCSGDVGLKLLQEKIVSFYHGRGYRVNTIVHSIKSTRDQWKAEESKIRESVLAMGIEWLEPKHEFGIIQRFQRDFLDPFFNHAEIFDIPLPMVQPAFERWMIQYNTTCDFEERRDLFGYKDDIDGIDKVYLKVQCN